jgi:hypothetical protein
MDQHNSISKVCQQQMIFDSSQHESRNLAVASERGWALCCGEKYNTADYCRTYITFTQPILVDDRKIWRSWPNVFI